MELNIKELNVDIIAPSTATYHKPDQGGSKIVVIGKPGCFAYDTVVLMWNSSKQEAVGTVAVQDVRVGDCLVGPEGEGQIVGNLCSGLDLLYEISYITSSSHNGTVVVNRSHMLTLWNIKEESIQDIPLTAFINNVLKSTDYLWMIKKTFHDNSFQKFQKFQNYENKLVEWSWKFSCEQGRYYGFELEGEKPENHRFLLADGSVVHNTGKTTLITSLLYEKSHIFPIGLVMSGTEDSNGHYQKLFPSSFVYNSLREKKIEDFITRQKVAKMHVPNPWAILLLDDCTDDPKILSKPLFQGLYKNGRHWKMLYILSLQYCMDVKPVVRTNIDGTFILRESSIRNRKVLWENYASIIPDFSTFCAIMDQTTTDYTALYIHNSTQSNRIEDCVFWYRAKPVPPGFKFGSHDFWKFDKQRLDPEYRDSFSL
jgi:hypothetical protein